jgi:DNA-binding transcriptional ArsR family regulator
MTDLAAASVSEHLKVLRKTGLLVLETRGRWRVYRSNPSLLQLAAKALADLAMADGGG